MFLEKIKYMGNLIAHEYRNLDFKIIWLTIKEKLPLLVESLENIFGTDPDGNTEKETESEASP